MNRILPLVIFAMVTAGLFGQDITLKEPQAKSGLDLLDAIKARAAERKFAKKDIPLADLSTILWAGNGQKGPDAVSGASKAGRTIPYSGDVAYVNVYVLTDKGVYAYEPEKKLLRQTSKGDARGKVTPENIKEAACMVLFTYDFAKTPPFLKKMPALMRNMADGTAAYAAENMMLAAAALKLGSIVMYNITPAAIAPVAKLGNDETPLFIVQLGYTQ
ncbi:MAG TPA: nitroreductase family protein [Spirochaetia bacterium]|nr:nitroreductase family protein [Spirochaetia bacterium]